MRSTAALGARHGRPTGRAYYLLGSAVEVVLLAAIVSTAWTWSRTAGVLSPRPVEQGADLTPRGEPVA
jgi:hypothetical protein